MDLIVKEFENWAFLEKFQIWIWDAFVTGARCTPEGDRWGQGTHMAGLKKEEKKRGGLYRRIWESIPGSIKRARDKDQLGCAVKLSSNRTKTTRDVTLQLTETETKLNQGSDFQALVAGNDGDEQRPTATKVWRCDLRACAGEMKVQGLVRGL